MRFFNKKFLNLSVILSAMFVTAAVAEQAPNPRATGVATARGDVRMSGAAASVTPDTTARTAVRRGGASTTTTRSNNSGTISVRGNSRSATTQPVAATRAARSATAVRSATPQSARAATNSAVSRAGLARATAVFNDISKIGGGYAACRESYATCMDQFCANANDTYRRCYCSDKFINFRNTEAALDEAKTLLLQFQDNNLNAVDKTAAEVTAMYSATVGERAIRRDTSAAQKTLNEISDLLSGKKSATTTNSNSGSLGVLSLDFSDSMDDIWNGDADSLFSGGNSDLSAKEGAELYNAANRQCLKLVDNACESTAVLNMAKSAYSIMITQDCNLYEKKIDKERETVKQTAREAEKILRTARLEEYRAHNSADVNECLDKVRSAILSDVACGANYKKCLDYSGAYINATTGEVIYSTHLFKLTEQIKLDGNSNVVEQNPNFNTFLDDKRMFATSALDTCRDMADIVWSEFKRAAIIEIAQAQDAKIEEVKMSCVSIMADCYDTQTAALKSFDNTKSQRSDSLVAYTSKQLCADQVNACAALYGNGDCAFDSKTGKINNIKSCGLEALLNFVDTVDDIRITEGCETALNSYIKELCTPTGTDQKYPMGCRSLTEANLRDTITQRAELYCGMKSNNSTEYLNTYIDSLVKNVMTTIEEELGASLMELCESLDGYWMNANSTEGDLLTAFYAKAFGGRTGDTELSYGRCVVNNTMVQCLGYNTDSEKVATYDRVKDECTFTDAWYQRQCESMGGYYENASCYMANTGVK